MQKIYSYLVCLAALIVLLASCKKEGDQFYIKDATSPANVLTASSNAIVLTQANENASAVTFSWTATDFGEKAI
ncbi:MAG: SusE domain-containing protein, partial [Ferruginibacter sp.]